MRIISGSLKGRRITAPQNLPTRPTTDFAKEALFNILNNQYYFDEISVLDLFSGIGSISLEFASRGSKQIVSVDEDFGCVKFLNDTVHQLGLSDRFSVVKKDAFQFLSQKAFQRFDIVFADPPYEFTSEEYLQLIESIFKNNWLTEEGLLILEHSSAHHFQETSYFNQSKKYGNVHFSFFQK